MNLYVMHDFLVEVMHFLCTIYSYFLNEDRMLDIGISSNNDFYSFKDHKTSVQIFDNNYITDFKGR